LRENISLVMLARARAMTLLDTALKAAPGV